MTTLTLDGMFSARWNRLSEAERNEIRSDVNLSPQLIGLEGWRVEVETTYSEPRRFIVSRSTGWMPSHIELARRDSSGGCCADMEYKSIRKLYRVR